MESEQLDPLLALTVDLNRRTALKEEPEGAEHDYERRLTWAEVVACAAEHGVAVMLLPGYEEWCPTIGGYWRVVIACPGDDIDVQNDSRAILLEDSDSPHVLPAWTLLRRDDDLRRVDLPELVKQDRTALTKVRPGKRTRRSPLSA